ncbi:hypothetical protein BC936DRAFT_148390 [Jimgerdemannia flammicorona]|uniref:Uncharacterized protein n=1 Tax=Jimgerdemannia flammicorona TaxID=994334 RepID=A0A433D362_9FUNG|nr:hypothetical protein BC936DRAFT_148390 [Jimgerdemannia flammicorona]
MDQDPHPDATMHLDSEAHPPTLRPLRFSVPEPIFEGLAPPSDTICDTTHPLPDHDHDRDQMRATPAPLAVKPAYRKRAPPVGSDGLVRPIRSHLHRALGDALLGGRIGVIGAGSIRPASGTARGAGYAPQPAAAKSLRLILHDELVQEERMLEELKAELHSHLSQLQLEEVMLKGMLDCNADGVDVSRMPLVQEGEGALNVVVVEMDDEGESAGFSVETIDGKGGKAMEVDGEVAAGAGADVRIRSTPSEQDDGSDYEDDGSDSDEEEDEETARKALSMMLERYGDEGA